MEGDCYQLASRYLQTTNSAYIISEGIRGKYCTWNFKGNTRADFAAWCKREGLVCGGNPFYVGYDSVWFNGEFMPHQRAIYLKKVEDDEKAEKHRLDSLQNLSLVQDTLPIKAITIEYLEIGKSTAEKIGFNYSEYIGTAKFWDYEDLFSVTIQARELGDTTYIYRTYTTAYDTLLHVFWGGSRDKIKHSNVTSSGIVSNDYVSETYGLTFDMKGMHYTYTHSTDYEHSISGDGRLVYGKNRIFGSYQYSYTLVQGLPFLDKIPFIGALFRHTYDQTETRYIFIQVVIGEVSDA